MQEVNLRSGWENFLSNLSNVVNEGTDHQKMAAILTLGRICENLSGCKETNLSEKDAEFILFCILRGLDEDQKNHVIKEECLRGLINSVAFVDKLLYKDGVRDGLFNRVVKLMEDPNSELVRCSYQVVVELVKYVYESLGFYLPVISERSLKVLKDGVKKPSIAIIASEMWRSIAEAEQQRRKSDSSVNSIGHSKGYILEYYQKILPQVMLNLLSFNEQEPELGNNTIVGASQNTLIAFNEILGDECIGFTTEFIELMFKEDTVRNKTAGLIAYSCCIKSITKPQAFSMLMSSFQSIVLNLEDPRPLVRGATMRLLTDIAETQPDVLIHEKQINSYYNGFMRIIELGDMSMAIGIIGMFEKLAEGISYEEALRSSNFTNNMDLITLEIIKFSLKDRNSGDYNLAIDVAYKSLVPIILNCTDKNKLVPLLERFQEAVEIALRFSGDRRVMLVEGLLMCSGMVFQRCRLMKMALITDIPRKFFELAKQCMDNLKTVLSEALFLMGCVAGLMGTDFYTLVETYTSYCIEGIKNSKNNQTINSAFDSLALVSRDCTHLLTDKFIDINIVPLIFSRMEEVGVQAEEKIALFVNFGDFFIGNYGAMAPHIGDVMKKYEEGFSAVVEMLVEYRLLEPKG